jgi:uncharacterized protein (TIGR02246 family)
MDLDQVGQAIGEGNTKFGEGFRQGDAGAVAALYTVDAILLTPNSDTIQGIEGIHTFWSGAMQMGVKDVILTTVDLMETGDFVCEIGNYKLTIQQDEQNTMEDIGKYLVIWKQTADGDWRLHIDIWNTSLPVQ